MRCGCWWISQRRMTCTSSGTRSTANSFYGGEPLASLLEFSDAVENVIVIDSVSKRFSACGARVGVVISGIRR